MKKILFMGLLCLFASYSNAQKIKVDFNQQEKDDRVSPKVQEDIDRYALKVRDIVISEKLAMKADIDRVDQKLKDRLISEKEAATLKSDIALKYSDEINDRIKALHFNVDSLTRKQVQYTILNTDLETLKNEKQIKIHHSKKVNELAIYFAYGIITLPNGSDQALNNHLKFSNGIDAGLIYNRQLSRTSPFKFHSGLMLSWRTLRFDDNYFVNRDQNGVIDFLQATSNLSKSKLRGTYLVAPIGFSYQISKLETAEDGTKYRKSKGPMSIGLNLYGGVLISNNNIVEGDQVNQRSKKPDYGLNPYSYGAQLSVKIVGVNLFVKKDFSSYFKSGVFDNRKMWQFGISTGF